MSQWPTPQSQSAPESGVVQAAFCRHCGQQIGSQAVVCTHCGCPPYSGSQYCQACGVTTNPAAEVCIKCGVALARRRPGGANSGEKSKVLAGILGITLGSLGVHRFYLGYNREAVTMLLMGTIGWILVLPGLAAVIWGIVEGVKILNGTGLTTDAEGRPLTD